MGPAPQSDADRKALSFAMTLSLGIGLVMFLLKVGAYLLTGSAAILSDAAESVVHVAAVLFATYSLKLSYKPADQSHPYGHAKIAFFSAGFEGAMIMLAAVYIIFESVRKWIGGLSLENLGLGTALTAIAVLINGGLGGYLVWLGRRKNSIILAANGRHVLTDCWTSLAVLVSLGLVHFTHWLPFDPICGILMALNILVSGAGLVRTSFGGLMDRADPDTQQRLNEVLTRETAPQGLTFHRLRHRHLGDAHWVEVHLVFPAGTSLAAAHREATRIEQSLETSLEPRAYVTTHLESAEDHDQLHPQERESVPPAPP
ncbi:MAG: cation diffusion facilitator family transporter [Verrucomicrobia bacterium]|nr:cation diffusion facilitator family transporter [Verrucomicrobiota bacterium]